MFVSVYVSVCVCGFWDVNTLETGVEFFIAIRFNLYETRKLFEYFMVSSGLILLSSLFSLHSSVLCQLLLPLLLRELKELMKFQLALYQFSWQARGQERAG